MASRPQSMNFGDSARSGSRPKNSAAGACGTLAWMNSSGSDPESAPASATPAAGSDRRPRAASAMLPLRTEKPSSCACTPASDHCAVITPRATSSWRGSAYRCGAVSVKWGAPCSAKLAADPPRRSSPASPARPGTRLAGCQPSSSTWAASRRLRAGAVRSSVETTSRARSVGSSSASNVALARPAASSATSGPAAPRSTSAARTASVSPRRRACTFCTRNTRCALSTRPSSTAAAQPAAVRCQTPDRRSASRSNPGPASAAARTRPMPSMRPRTRSTRPAFQRSHASPFNCPPNSTPASGTSAPVRSTAVTYAHPSLAARSPRRPPIAARSRNAPLADPATPTRRSSQCRPPRCCSSASADSRRSERAGSLTSAMSITAPRRRTCRCASSHCAKPPPPPGCVVMPAICQRPSGWRNTASVRPSTSSADRRGARASKDAVQSKLKRRASTRVTLPSAARNVASRSSSCGVTPLMPVVSRAKCTG